MFDRLRQHDEVFDRHTGLTGYVEKITLHSLTVRFDTLLAHGSLHTLTLSLVDAQVRLDIRGRHPTFFANQTVDPNALDNLNIIFCNRH